MKNMIIFVSLGFFICACSTEKDLHSNSVKLEKGIHASMRKSKTDTMEIVMSVTNNSDEKIIIPLYFVTTDWCLYVTMPDGKVHPETICGGTMRGKTLNPGEHYEFQQHLSYYSLLLTTLDIRKSGWYIITWKAGKYNMEKSIKVYYDFEYIERILHLSK